MGNRSHYESRVVNASDTEATHPSSTISQRAPSAYDVSTSRRGVRSTRTPIGYGEGVETHRSQTLPPGTNLEPPNVARRNVRAPVSSPTMPLPNTRQRTPSGGRRHLLGPDSNYIVEPLPPSSFPSHEKYQPEAEEHYHDANLAFLDTPPPMPEALLDARQSVSSYYTDPTTYYSMDDNWSSVRAPTMPVPGHNPAQSLEDRSYSQDSYSSSPPWPASPAPSMPMPMHESEPPQMPNPHTHIPARGMSDWYTEDEDDAGQETGYATIRRPKRVTLGESHSNMPTRPQIPQPPTPPSRSPRTRYGDLPLIMPEIPPPPTSPPPVPSQASPIKPSSGYRPDSMGGSTRPSGASAPTSPNTTAPLRVQHHSRPSASMGAAAGSSTAPGNTGRVSAAQNGQPVAHKVDAANATGVLKPGGQNATPSAGKHESRPSTTAPVPSLPKPFAVADAPSKPVSTYTQATSHRLDSPLPNYPASVNTESIASSAPFKGHGRQEVRPTSQASSAFKPQNASTQRPSSVQTYATGTGGRPGGSTAPIPSSSNRPTVSAPQPQQRPSVSGGSRPANDAEKQNATPTAPSAAVTASTPSRPHLRGTQSQMDTQYVNMLLALDDIPFIHNLSAGFFNWILLAGFILFPGTFTSLENLSASNGGPVSASLINAVTQLPL